MFALGLAELAGESVGTLTSIVVEETSAVVATDFVARLTEETIQFTLRTSEGQLTATLTSVRITRSSVLTLVQKTIEFAGDVDTTVGQTHLFGILTLLFGTLDDLLAELPSESLFTPTDPVRARRRFQTTAVVQTRIQRAERLIEILRTVQTRVAESTQTFVRLTGSLVNADPVVF